MNPLLESLMNRIISLKGISEIEKSALIADVLSIEKKFNEDEFMLMRLDKDKSIVVNILNATIADLKKSKLEIENSNKQLIDHQKELKRQKKIIEKNSKKLSKNLRKLTLSYSELENFTNVASHDLKSPLRSISGFAHLLKHKYANKIDADADKYLEFIISSTKHMYEVIDALLDYSKIGEQNLQLEDIDLNSIVNLALKNLSLDLKESGMQVSCEKLPRIKGDKIGLLQLFQNLLENAVKFKSEIPPRVQIKYDPKPQLTRIKVIDNGIGIAEDYQKKVFTPFQRLLEIDTKGLGMGLAICKKVVKLHQGKIYYRRNIDQGTTFVIEFPVYKN